MPILMFSVAVPLWSDEADSRPPWPLDLLAAAAIAVIITSMSLFGFPEVVG